MSTSERTTERSQALADGLIEAADAVIGEADRQSVRRTAQILRNTGRLDSYGHRRVQLALGDRSMIDECRFESDPEGFVHEMADAIWVKDRGALDRLAQEIHESGIADTWPIVHEFVGKALSLASAREA
jgi:hypothetical protein